MQQHALSQAHAAGNCKMAARTLISSTTQTTTYISLPKEQSSGLGARAHIKAVAGPYLSGACGRVGL